jgi:hypothetical protein
MTCCAQLPSTKLKLHLLLKKKFMSPVLLSFNLTTLSQFHVGCTSNGRIVNDKIQWMWKEGVVTCYKTLSQHLSGWNEKNNKNPQSGWPATGMRYQNFLVPPKCWYPTISLHRATTHKIMKASSLTRTSCSRKFQAFIVVQC